MSFNRWAAAHCKFDNSCRLAFEAVWEAMVSGGKSESEASYLLTDLVESLPQPEFADDGDEW